MSIVSVSQEIFFSAFPLRSSAELPNLFFFFRNCFLQPLPSSYLLHEDCFLAPPKRAPAPPPSSCPFVSPDAPCALITGGNVLAPLIYLPDCPRPPASLLFRPSQHVVIRDVSVWVGWPLASPSSPSPAPFKLMAACPGPPPPVSDRPNFSPPRGSLFLFF